MNPSQADARSDRYSIVNCLLRTALCLMQTAHFKEIASSSRSHGSPRNDSCISLCHIVSLPSPVKRGQLIIGNCLLIIDCQPPTEYCLLPILSPSHQLPFHFFSQEVAGNQGSKGIGNGKRNPNTQFAHIKRQN